MIKLHKFLNVISYNVHDKTFLENSIYNQESDLICEISNGNGEYYLTCIFDVISQEILEITAEDYKLGNLYRWTTEDFAEQQKDNLTNWVGKEYYDLELAEDILEKSSAIVAGKPYDTRVLVPLELSDEDFMSFATLAHKKDVTFNQLIEQALRAAIAEKKIV
jgi:hypothetical protein